MHLRTSSGAIAASSQGMCSWFRTRAHNAIGPGGITPRSPFNALLPAWGPLLDTRREPFEFCLCYSERLVAAHDKINIVRIDLDPEAASAGLFGCDQC